MATAPKTPAQVHADLLWSQIDAAGKRDNVAPQLVEMAAETWTRWQEAAELVRRDGLTIATNHGVIANPAAAIEKSACATYQALLGRLGLAAAPYENKYKANKVTRLAPVDSIAELMNRPPAKVAKAS